MAFMGPTLQCFNSGTVSINSTIISTCSICCGVLERGISGTCGTSKTEVVRTHSSFYDSFVHNFVLRLYIAVPIVVRDLVDLRLFQRVRNVLQVINRTSTHTHTHTYTLRSDVSTDNTNAPVDGSSMVQIPGTTQKAHYYCNICLSSSPVSESEAARAAQVDELRECRTHLRDQYPKA